MLNPLNRPDCDPQLTAFVEAAAQSIEQKMSRKALAFFEDTNHFVPQNFMFMFSKPVLSALARANKKHLMIEYRDRAEQVFLDAIAEGRLTPEQYADVHERIPGKKDDAFVSIPPDILRSHAASVGEGVVIARDMGIKIHCVNADEGLVKPDAQKRYIFLKTDRNRRWLNYLLKNPKYFSDPEEMIEDLIAQHGARYAQRGIDLEKTLLYTPDLNARQVIVGFWNIETNNKGYEKQISQMGYKGISAEASGQLRVIFDRHKRDPDVMRYVNNLRGDDEAAVFYGKGHLRNQFGGFTRGLTPDQYAVVTLLAQDDGVGYLHQLHRLGYTPSHPDDLLVLLEQQQVFEYGRLVDSPQSGIAPVTN